MFRYKLLYYDLMKTRSLERVL